MILAAVAEDFIVNSVSRRMRKGCAASGFCESVQRLTNRTTLAVIPIGPVVTISIGCLVGIDAGEDGGFERCVIVEGKACFTFGWKWGAKCTSSGLEISGGKSLAVRLPTLVPFGPLPGPSRIRISPVALRGNPAAFESHRHLRFSYCWLEISADRRAEGGITGGGGLAQASRCAISSADALLSLSNRPMIRRG